MILTLLCLFLFISCKNNSGVEYINFNVVSPIGKNTYYDDLSIVFSIDRALNSVEWYSSINGRLGSGSQISVRLSAGKHKIEVKANNINKTFYIRVLERGDSDSDKTKFRVMDNDFSCQFKNKSYNAYLVCLDGRADKVCFKVNSKKKSFSNKRLLLEKKNISKNNSLKLFRCNTNVNLKLKPNKIKRYRNQNEKEFFIVNTANQMADPHKIMFNKYYSSSTLDVWIPKTFLGETSVIDSCIDEFENLVLLRLTQIFGNPTDIDDNHKMTIVLSPTINEEKKALGFFNPADFFKNNIDKNSENYNPTSNEADIIYAGMPSNDPSNAYYYKAIVATIGHELTHAITFSKKTYVRIKNGMTDFPRMEIFLDEGISHLAENLIGYGISGGNIKFFNKFLQHTSDYSFCKNNIFGFEDSAGQRGAMTLFLSWCFWKKGGMDWDSGNNKNLIDKGGISFLKKLISSEYLSWDAIGDAFGTPTDKLFLQMLDELRVISAGSSTISYKIDPLTNEAVEFLPCMGKIVLLDSELNISHPKPKIEENQIINTILPYSFVFVDKKIINTGSAVTDISVCSDNLVGKLLFCLVK